MCLYHHHEADHGVWYDMTSLSVKALCSDIYRYLSLSNFIWTFVKCEVQAHWSNTQFSESFDEDKTNTEGVGERNIVAKKKKKGSKLPGYIIALSKIKLKMFFLW